MGPRGVREAAVEGLRNPRPMAELGVRRYRDCRNRIGGSTPQVVLSLPRMVLYLYTGVLRLSGIYHVCNASSMINSGTSTSNSSSTGPRLSHPVGRKNARSIRERYFRSQSGCFVARLFGYPL